MRRFFIQPTLDFDTQDITLDKDESRHITKVLRLKPGVVIELYDGTGFLYQAAIINTGKIVSAHIQTKEFFKPPQPDIILHAGLLKNKKMELVLQKTTELGVAAVHLFTSDHTSTTIPDAKKMARYQKIIQESCKQSERLHPMKIFKPTSLKEQLTATRESNQYYLFWERECHNDPGSIDNINHTQPLHIFTGPEGGFSEQEIASLADNIKTISLGPQILRAETAIIAGISIMAYLAGRFKPHRGI